MTFKPRDSYTQKSSIDDIQMEGTAILKNVLLMTFKPRDSYTQKSSVDDIQMEGTAILKKVLLMTFKWKGQLYSKMFY